METTPADKPEVVDLENENDVAMEEVEEQEVKEEEEDNALEMDSEAEEIEEIDEKPEDKVKPDLGKKSKMKKKVAPKMFSVYVGNVPFTASEEDVKKHFNQLKDDIVNVAMFTYARGKFKGCCRIDFNKMESQEKAIKMNKTEMDGRPIKVERGVNMGKKKTKYEMDLARRVYRIVNAKHKQRRSKWKIKRIPSKLKKLS